MSIHFQCGCGRKLTAPDGTSGKRAKCPVCQNVMRVPDPSAPASEPPPSSAPAPQAGEPARSKAELARASDGLKHLASHLEKRSGARQLKMSGRALVVDDEPDTLTTVSELLEHHGFEVLRASNGEQAIEMAYEHRPDVIVLDVMLPGINGFEVCRRLKDPSQKGSAGYDVHTPILMLTAKAKGRDVQYAKSVGANGYIKKPFQPLKLYQKLDKLMNK